MNNCPLHIMRDIFGVPGTGIHSIRFLDSAGLDYALSIIGAIIIAWFTGIPLVLTTIVILSIGLLLHVLFGVNTHAVRYLGLGC